MSRIQNRREFLRSSSIATAGLLLGASLEGRPIAATEKLNLAYVGTNNRARANIAGTRAHNCVAFCDIDDAYCAEAAEMFPGAEKYHDFRKMLERTDIDAVVVSTPDHTHAVAAAAAMRSGRHVYCEKPLAHEVWEARQLAKLAKKHRRVTQLGTQIHAGDNYRRVVEIIKSGAIGDVGEVHVWVGKSWDGSQRPPAAPVPKGLHFDLWLGPAPKRDFHAQLHPADWRRWWDFGGGTLADMGCHHVDLSHWALDLRHPIAVEADGPEPNAEGAPQGLRVRLEYPKRGKRPPVKLTWYDGGRHAELLREHGIQWGDGTLFVGSKGKLLASYGEYRLLPEKDFADYTPPEPSIPRSMGHYEEWIAAIKAEDPSRTTCNFDYSGALTEAVLLGNLAYRANAGRLEWDAKKLRVTNHEEANRFVRREYRAGWEL